VTPDFLIAVWKSTINEGSGHFSKEIRYPHVLESICKFLHEEGPNRPPWEVCGVMLFRFVDAQPFGDCNHRTGWFLTQELMARAGYRLVRPEAEVIDFLRHMVERTVTREKPVDWVRESFKH
jgi:prophage maintenance system killer protein